MNIPPLLARRASFSMLAPEQGEEGMTRFANMIERERKRSGKRTGF